MPDNSGWMGDPNDIKGKLLFEQSKKGANPDAAKKAADAKAKLAKAKAAAVKKAAAARLAALKKPTLPASPTH
jgi:hypothetical protein